MNSFWKTFRLAAVPLAAWAGTPLWMNVRHRNRGPELASPPGNPELEAVLVSVQGDAAGPAGPRAPAVRVWDEHLLDSQVLAQMRSCAAAVSVN
jgi:hypothetical protein